MSTEKFNHPPKGFYRMSQLATTAARKERKYTTKDGTTRIIKARPERQGVLPMGETTIWDKVRAGEFPAPIKLTERITAWRIEDIEAWMAQKDWGLKHDAAAQRTCASYRWLFD